MPHKWNTQEIYGCRFTAFKERLNGKDPAESLREIIAEVGPKEAAKKVGITGASIYYWMSKLRIRVEPIVLLDGEVAEIKKVKGG